MMYRKIEGLDYDFKESFVWIMNELKHGMIDTDEAKSIFDETLKIGLIQCDDRTEEVRAWYGKAMTFLERYL
jgi:hypothetical protein